MRSGKNTTGIKDHQFKDKKIIIIKTVIIKNINEYPSTLKTNLKVIAKSINAKKDQNLNNIFS